MKEHAVPDLAEKIESLPDPDPILDPERIAEAYRAQVEEYPLPDPEALIKLAGNPAALAEEQFRLGVTLARLEEAVAQLEALVALEEIRLAQIESRLRPQAEGNREKDKEAWVKNHPDYRALENQIATHQYLLRRLKGRRAAYQRLVASATEALQTARALVKLGG